MGGNSQYHDGGEAADLTYGGDANWSEPFHGSDGDGNDVTASFGQGSRDGDTLIADGHVSSDQFYGPGGHDHSHPSDGGYEDRGAYSG